MSPRKATTTKQDGRTRTVIAVTISPSLRDRINDAAHRLDIDRSAFMRQAAATYLRKLEREEQEAQAS